MDTLQTVDDLQKYITSNGIKAEMIRNIGDTPTVPEAASALGVQTDQIIKTLLFIVGQPNDNQRDNQGGNYKTNQQKKQGEISVVVISNGTNRVDKRPLSTYFQVGRKRVKLAPPDVVIAQLGYPAGGVPPFGHRTRLPVFLDESVLALSTQFDGTAVIYGGGGDAHTMIKLTVDELLRVTKPEILALSEQK